MKIDVLYRKRSLKVVLLVSTAVLLLASQALQASDRLWFEFTLPCDDGSPSFLSFDNGGPITQQISVVGDHLYADGSRIRLFGINFYGSAACPSNEQAERTAKRLAKLGFNFAKLAGLEGQILANTDPIEFNTTKLDNMFYFISELKDNGVYVGLQLNIGANRAQPSVYFNPDTIQLQKQYAQELLTQKSNLANDPVLALVQFINEVYMLGPFQNCDLHTDAECEARLGPNAAPLSEALLPPGQWQPKQQFLPKNVDATESDFLDVEWNARLLAKYGSRTGLKNAWEDGCSSGKTSLEAGEDPSNSTVERILFQNCEDYCPNRLMDTVTFYYQLAQEHIADMFDYLRNSNTLGLGDRMITTVENFWGMPTKLAQHGTNVMAQHVPWAHPHYFGEQYQYVNAPMVEGPVQQGQLIHNWPLWIELNNTIWKASAVSAVEDRPLIMAEYSHPSPNEFKAEGPLLIACYGRLQDWDGIILHEYGSTSGNNRIDSAFELADDPATMAQIPVAARVFRNGLVEASSDTLIVPFWEDGAFDGESGVLNDWWNCLAQHYCYWNSKGIDAAWSLVRKTRMEFCETEGECSTSTNPGSAPTPVFDSDTGQLHWDMNKGLVTVNAPSAQAAIGFVDSNINLSCLQIDASAPTDFAVISLVPLDDANINSSEKLLLTAVSRVKNTGMSPEPPQLKQELTLIDWGGSPVLLEAVEAQVTLTIPQASLIRVYRLDETGNKTTQIPVTKAGNDFTFSIGSHSTLWYGIEVEPLDTAAVFRVIKEGDVLADGSFYGQDFRSGAADVAEWVSVSERVEPGDVVELDPKCPHHYRKARGPCSNLVAGVVSSDPGFVLGSEDLGSSSRLSTADPRPSAADSALLALVGIVPVKVVDEGGLIQPGDLLTASSTPGYAMRWSGEESCDCGLVGKALEPLTEASGTILVLLMSH